MKTIRFILCISIIIVNTQKISLAQFQTAVRNDITTSNVAQGVSNTGNDIMYDQGNGVTIMVSVWDGTNGRPGLAWDDFNGNAALVTLQKTDAYDPDVTLIGDAANLNIYAIVAYYSASTSSGSFMLECYVWFGTYFTLMNGFPITLMSNAAYQTAINVDGTETGDFAIIWDKDSSGVKIPKFSTGRCSSAVCGTYFNSASLVPAGTTPISIKYPDVCLYDTIISGAPGTLLMYSSYYNTGTSKIDVQVERWQDIDQISPNVNYSVFSTISPSYSVVDPPRIACASKNASSYNVSVVYSDGNKVESWNNKPGGPPSLYTYNAGAWNPPGALNGVPNKNPVITYDINNDIFIGWTFNNSSSFYSGAGFHPGMILPIAAYCDVAAVPQGTKYWDVPRTITGDAQILSLCGKKVSKVGASWWDNSSLNRNIYYKAQSTQASSFKIGYYNNPETKPKKIVIFDIQGKKIYEATCEYFEASETINKLDIRPGIYFIKTITSFGEKTSKHYKL